MRVNATRRSIIAAATIAATIFASDGYAAPTPPSAATGTKVVIIAEENKTYSQIIGSVNAPYLNGLARTYGSATNMTANYPVACPSLAAYILITSGTTGGICDDKGPKHHPLADANIFAQIDAAHLTWRTYAEQAPTACARTDSPDGVFLVRHTPIVYYTSETTRCPSDDVALGTTTSGALRTDITTGMPSYAFVTPDACDEMHGATSCPGHRIGSGDTWLRTWIPLLMSSPDYRSGHEVIIITWDEGSATDNHIPTLLIAPKTTMITSATAFTHCSTLRTTEDLLHLAPLGCAASAPSMVTPFHLP
jgi:hypothetical protein